SPCCAEAGALPRTASEIAAAAVPSIVVLIVIPLTSNWIDRRACRARTDPARITAGSQRLDVALERFPDEAPRRLGVVRLARAERLGPLEHRHEQLDAVDLVRELERAAFAVNILPRGAYVGPERRGPLPVLLRRREIEADDPLVSIEADFPREHGPALAPLVEVYLEIVFLVNPARRRDRVTVRADEHVVVVAHARFAAR